MRQGKIVQSGIYRELLIAGADFGALVAAHAASMELVEHRTTTAGENDAPAIALEQPRTDQTLAKAQNGSVGNPTKEKGTAKLIDEEQRETGRVSWRVYKMYGTEAWGWWGAFVVLAISVVWQVSLMASDYWLAFETSAKNAASFNPFVFIRVYAIISIVSVVLVMVRAFVVAFLGLATAQLFFRQLLLSIIHAPMSFFDTTPSGRILSRVRIFKKNVEAKVN